VCFPHSVLGSFTGLAAYKCVLRYVWFCSSPHVQKNYIKETLSHVSAMKVFWINVHIHVNITFPPVRPFYRSAVYLSTVIRLLSCTSHVIPLPLLPACPLLDQNTCFIRIVFPYIQIPHWRNVSKTPLESFKTNIKFTSFVPCKGGGDAVVQLCQTLHYKPDGSGFDSRWCHCNFSSTWSFRPHYGPGVDSACNRNQCQGSSLGVKTAGA
jgi:hypothetical protein